MLLTEPWHSGTDPLGVGSALLAAACWATYIVLTQHVGDRVTGLKGLAVSMPVAGVLGLAMSSRSWPNASPGPPSGSCSAWPCSARSSPSPSNSSPCAA
ncbi:hypothetical protein NKH77_09500 [Streptomyces sp. M19]